MTERGWLAKLGIETFSHRFGGSSWSVSTAVQTPIPIPTLLMVFDLTDARLAPLADNALCELPLAAVLVCPVGPPSELYKIEPQAKRLILIDGCCMDMSAPWLEDLGVFAEKPLKLEPMTREDDPLNKEEYWQACENFIGGTSFIRVLGSPLWMEDPVQPICPGCKRPMLYVCSIGYEQYNKPSGLIDNMPFFTGEQAFYFHLCKACLFLNTTSQST